MPVNRARDWLEQARQDLEHARKSRDMGDYAWACFAAQQAAEKAARVLDKHYIAPRYPDVHPGGPAYRQYIKAEADEAVQLAEKVLAFCEAHL